MSRTTSEAVAGILEEQATLSLGPFIEAANYLVTKVCATATNSDGTSWYSDAELELIERWLSAHFYHVAATRADTEQAGSVSQKLRSKVDLGLNLTHYGQQAMLLDTAGGLRDLNAHRRQVVPKVLWVGIEEDEDE